MSGFPYFSNKTGLLSRHLTKINTRLFFSVQNVLSHVISSIYRKFALLNKILSNYNGLSVDFTNFGDTHLFNKVETIVPGGHCPGLILAGGGVVVLLQSDFSVVVVVELLPQPIAG